MVQKYVFVRMRKADFEKIVNEKKIPIEQDLSKMAGKVIKIKNPQLFRLASEATWDFGTDFEHKFTKAIKLDKRRFRL